MILLLSYLCLKKMWFLKSPAGFIRCTWFPIWSALTALGNWEIFHSGFLLLELIIFKKTINLHNFYFDFKTINLHVLAFVIYMSIFSSSSVCIFKDIIKLKLALDLF